MADEPSEPPLSWPAVGRSVRAFRATVALAAAGCSGGHHDPIDGAGSGDAITADAPAGDAPADAAEPTAPLTVLALGPGGAPLAGAEVIFVDGAGTERSDVLTETAGVVVREMPAGSSVTVVIREPGLASVSSYTDLPLGATVTVQPRFEYTFNSIALSWPALPMMDTYAVDVTCHTDGGVTTTSGTSITLRVDARCSDELDAVVIATDLDNQLAPAAQRATAVSPPITFPDGWAAATVLDGHVANLPTNLTGPVAANALGLIAPERPAMAFGYSSVGPSGAIDAPFVMPDGVAPVVQLYLPGPGVAMIRERVAGASYAGDLDHAVLPWMTELTADAPSRTIGWSTTDPIGPALAPIDVVLADATIVRPGLLIEWHVISPGSRIIPTAGGAQLAIPDVPGDRDIEPSAGDAIDPLFVIVMAVNAGADVDRLRSRFESTFHEDFDVFADPALTRFTISAAQ